jgi:hypothetical protein
MSSLSDFERRVCLAQIAYVTKTETPADSLSSYGDLYPFVQKYANDAIALKHSPALFRDVVLPTKKVTKAADKIKRDNSIRMIEDFFSSKRNVFAHSKSEMFLQSTNIELKVVGFCYLFYSHEYSSESSFIFSVIISAQRFLKYIKTLLSPDLSPTVVSDLEYYCSKAIKMSKYSGSALQTLAPELITLSPFDQYIPKFPLEPYPAQKQLYDMFSNPEFTKNGGLVFLSTATNSGKTFSIVGLSKRIDMLKKYIPIRLLFSCVVASVRDKVEELLRFACISYGVMREEKCPVQGCQNYFSCSAHEHSDLFTIYDPTLKEEMPNTNSNRKTLELEGFSIVKKGNRTDSWRVAILDPETNIITKNPTGNSTPRDFSIIVAPPHLAVSYMSNPDKQTNTAMFLDEFTIGATNLASSVLETHVKLIRLAPKWTFLSNANFVGDSRLDPLVETRAVRFPNSKMYNISSQTVYTCSEIKTHGGLDVLPHYDCVDIPTFSQKLKNIMKNQFKGRMYNVSALKAMHKRAVKCIKYHFSYDDDEEDTERIRFFTDKLPDIDKIFSDVANLYPDNIRKLSIEILKVIESIPNDEVPNDEVPNDEVDEDEKIQSLFSICPKYKSDPEIPTYEYSGGMNLIGAVNPPEYAFEHFSRLLEKIKSKITLSKLSTDHDKLESAWENQYSRAASMKYRDEQEKMITLSDISDSRPSLQFPEEFQLGVKERLRTPIQIANIDFLSMKNSDMVLLLFAGVGIYDENETDKLYLQTLFSLGIKGQLAYIVSNVSYGMDYPFTKVYISDEFSEKKSMNEVYQLLSRGGRGQMSNLAKIFVSSGCAQKILDVNEEGDTLEVNNILSLWKCT